MALNRRWVTVGGIAALLVIAILCVPIALGPRIKQRLLDAVGERFESQVSIESISIAMLPRPRVIGRGMVLRHKGRTDVPPLITIASFSAEASLIGFLRSPMHIARVELEGLEINVPPGGMHLPGDDDKKDDGKKDDTKTGSDGPKQSKVVVASLTSEHAVLRIIRRKPGKSPRIFEIHHLAMQDVGADHPWPFKADLTNPTPPGNIQTQGTFGPWNADDPSRTPLAADYRFDNADLGVFDGIKGILSSTGAFSGVLERIDVNGKTSVPAFALSDVGNPVPLEATFHSIVDGTNGNTLLEPVDALLGRSKIHTSGGVVEREGEDGRTVTLDIVMAEAFLEDILRLAVKGPQPPMTGALTLNAKFVLPPGHRDVMDKLRLDGQFAVATARFTKSTVQEKINTFSTKARGVNDDTPDPVVSDFKGRFVMRDGVIHFSEVTFAMPGTRVNVAGTYVMKSNAIDFRGTVRLDAKLSSLTTGVKSYLLRMVDGLFRHEDITVIPITIDGTAEQPAVKLDFGKVVKGG